MHKLMCVTVQKEDSCLVCTGKVVNGFHLGEVVHTCHIDFDVKPRHIPLYSKHIWKIKKIH